MATDVYRYGLKDKKGKRHHSFFQDGVHPSHFGYRVMMELLANFMRQVRSVRAVRAEGLPSAVPLTAARPLVVVEVSELAMVRGKH